MRPASITHTTPGALIAALDARVRQVPQRWCVARDRQAKTHTSIFAQPAQRASDVQAPCRFGAVAGAEINGRGA